MPRATGRRLLLACGACLALGTGACELFWSWDGVGGGTSAGGADAGCPPTALLCEDFEHPRDPSTWTVQDLPAGGIAAADIDTAQHHSGAHSLHAHIESPADVDGGITAEWTNAGPFPQPLYVRLYVYPVTPIADFEVFAELDQTSGDYPLTSLWLGSGGGVSSFGWIDSADMDPDANSDSITSPLALNAWTCVEWLVDANAQTLEVWVNGQPAFPPTTRPLPMSLDRFDVGAYVQTSLPLTSYDVWIDDVIIDQQRIGCGS